MARKILFLILTFFLSNCIVKKKTTYGEKKSITVEASDKKEAEPEENDLAKVEDTDSGTTDKADQIINTALTYSGVRYKYGGTSAQGMDCSGLLFVSFGKNEIELPRVSHEMAGEGKRIRLDKVRKGDLLFFKTSRRGKRINHVGLVVSVKEDEIKFIHSTTSRGVIVSSLREGFWNLSFVKATRVL
ncbi:MAG: C40 family peptidase [Flavobacteriaceae bacterium]